ncbi:MAG: hypothetical protein AAFR84_02980 [Pseudomonadota bacterium]
MEWRHDYHYEGGFRLEVRQHFGLYKDTYSAELHEGPRLPITEPLWSIEGCDSSGMAKYQGELAISALLKKRAEAEAA